MVGCLGAAKPEGRRTAAAIATDRVEVSPEVSDLVERMMYRRTGVPPKKSQRKPPQWMREGRLVPERRLHRQPLDQRLRPVPLHSDFNRLRAA